MTKTTITPNDLAETLAGSDNRDKIGKTFVRPLLRRHFTRDDSQRGSSWYLNDMQVAFVKSAWKAKRDGKSFDATATLKALKSRKPKAVDESSVPPIEA